MTDLDRKGVILVVKRIVTAWIGFLLLSLAPASGSALVYPHALFMDDRERSCVFYVQNMGNEPAEVEVSLVFGYPASDSTGGIHLEIIEDPMPGLPSAVAWVRALPRRLLIHPGDRQAVRVLADPPGDLPPGEYWGRVVVRSRKAAQIQPVIGHSGISVGLNLETRTLISLSYRKADVTTGVEIESFAAALQDTSLVTEIRLKRTGNAAFLGQQFLTLRNADGAVVGRWDRVVAVYYELYRKRALPLGPLPAGNYELHLEISTARTDIPQVDIIPAPSVGRIAHFRVG
jgi:hypothetical protein